MACFKHDSNETVRLNPGEEVLLEKQPAGPDFPAPAYVWKASACGPQHTDPPDPGVLERIPSRLTKTAVLATDGPAVFLCQKVCRDKGNGREVLYAFASSGKRVRVTGSAADTLCS